MVEHPSRGSSHLSTACTPQQVVGRSAPQHIPRYGPLLEISIPKYGIRLPPWRPSLSSAWGAPHHPGLEAVSHHAHIATDFHHGGGVATVVAGPRSPSATAMTMELLWTSRPT